MELQHRFDINFDILIETFSDNPERIAQLVPMIERLFDNLAEKGYEVKAGNCCIIPESIVLRKRKNGEQPSDVAKAARKDFIQSCEKFGIKQLFE